MFAYPVDGQEIIVLKAFLYIVGIEGCQRAYLHKSFRTKRQDIAQRTCLHCEIAKRGRNRAKRCGGIFQPVNGSPSGIGGFDHTGIGQELFETGTHPYRAGTRAATSVRCREGFMQVDMHNIEAHVAGTCHAEHRVKVSPVVIHQCTCFVGQTCYFRDIAFEKAECVRVGHHNRRNGFVEQRSEVVDIDRAVGTALHLDYLQSGYCRRGRVGAVGGIGHDNLATCLVATSVMISTYHHQAGQLAMSPCKRVQCELGHAADFRQRALQRIVKLEVTLRGRIGSGRVHT